MITLKSPREIEAMAASGKILAGLHESLRDFIRPGISTMDIELFAKDYLEKHDAKSEQLGYQGYPYLTCTSVNDEICHGFPTHKKLKNGDIVTVDMVVNYRGALSDSAWTYTVGDIDEQTQKLLDVTKASLYIGIEQAVVGNRIGDIGAAIQEYVEANGFSVVRDFCGHGIGPTLHEDPQVPHYGTHGTGTRLKSGMVITIEPMINAGGWQATLDDNEWTARTKDHSLSAQYEHTLAITDDGPVILTGQIDE
ncbi:type I methionyl aminopeptidase [Culicoidibacter larvae]|uniref:Methionine aminopeptidase n=1 Tax=Culicoidibacter larvae TaxID=2579976 RepID=A0A5R8QHQ1_9FIRM|nr:type I methionyl aminopeptidase [Culicoidibacter larvae]TLG76797.1 type I methionyl aminopeptidase [Culicoidibacter larvae]